MENENNFDPMTGEPIAKERQEAEPDRFDPMTGEPITQAAPIGYDPMTGAPIYAESQNAEIAAAGGKKKIWSVIAAAAAGVVVIAGVAIGGVMSGTFLSVPNKVLLAAKNTLSDQPKFMKDLDLEGAQSLIQSGRYTLDVTADMDDFDVSGLYISTVNEKQLQCVAKADGIKVGADVSLTASQLKLSVPKLTDDILVYNYKEDVDGYFADLLENADVEPEVISDALTALYDAKAQEKQVSELTKKMLKQVQDLKWEKTSAKNFKINGKSCKAKGYQVTITADDAEDMLEIVEDYLDEHYEELMKQIHSEMKDVYRALRDMPDMECEFYIYKNRLAAVSLDMDNAGEAELVFKGGDFRMQNMELEVGDRYDSFNLELTGKSNGSKENYELTAGRETLFELDYNSENGKYELAIGDNDLVVEGKINTERGVYGMSVEYRLYGKDCEISYTLSKEAYLRKFEGDETDICDLKESDIWKMMGNLTDEDSDEADF